MKLDLTKRAFKALNWRVIASSLTLVLANVLIGQVEVMTHLTMGDFILKMTAYFLYGRVWCLTK